MQFRRTAVAVAIAGIAAVSPQIASADTVLSGAIGIQIGADDLDVPLGNGLDSSDVELVLDEAVVGVVATHTMNNGLEAFGSVRFDGDGFSGSEVSDDNIFLGIKGGFGEIRVGEVPVAAEAGQVANDIFDQTDSVNQGVSYVGNFGPAGITLNWSPERNEDIAGIGARFGLGGFAIGAGVEERAELTNLSVGATYGLFGATIAAHVISRDEPDGSGLEETDIISVQAGYGIAGASVALTYAVQTQNFVAGGDADSETFRIDVGYGLGGGLNASVRININTFDQDGGVDINGDDVEDFNDWRFLVSKTF